MRVAGNIDAEDAIVGAILYAGGSLDERTAAYRVVDRCYSIGLLPQDFFRPVTGELWRTLLVMRQAGLPLDPVSVADYLDHQVGGWEPTIRARLETLAQTAPPIHAAAHYARIVRREARARTEGRA